MERPQATKASLCVVTFLCSAIFHMYTPGPGGWVQGACCWASAHVLKEPALFPVPSWY